MIRLSCFLALLLSTSSCGNDTTSEKTPPIVIVDTGTDTQPLIDMGDDTIAPADMKGDTSTPDMNEEIGEIIYEQKGLVITNGQSSLFDFDVPEDTQSVSIMISGKESQFYVLSSWKNGDRTDLVPEGWARSSPVGPSLCLSCPNRVSGTEAVSVGYAPNNQDVEVKKGTHTASVFGYIQNGFQLGILQSGQVDIIVLAHRYVETPFARLALNFHFTGANGLTAESAKTNVDFQTEVDKLKDIYSQAKIEIDQVSYIDIDSSYQIVENIIAPDSDLQKMFKLGVASAPKGVNVFFVDELLLQGPGGGFGILLGVSGGIPGPIVSGTARSGVAIAMKSNPGLPSTPGFVMAHEIGHHLGLFHTSEQAQGGSPRVHDQISDTPEGDPSLLMYFAGQGRTLSANQIKVMRNNPRLRY